MEFKPSPQQHLFLWCLAVEPGRPISKMSFALKPTSLRSQLEKAGMIEICRQGRNMIPALTEQGWYALEQNLGTPISKGRATSTILEAVLSGIARQIMRGGLSLSDVVSPATPESASDKQKDLPTAEIQMPAIEIKRRVYDACRKIVGNGVYNVRIRIAELRSQLADVPRPALDDALKELERSQDAALYPLDDPREIRPEDEAAALPNASGAKRHVLYLSRAN